MKNLFLFVLLFGVLASYAVPPVFGPLANVDLIQQSGRNIILINDVDDGDAGLVQNISFTATSGNTDIITIDSCTFNKNNKFAVLYVQEKGVIGNSLISISAKDDGGGSDTYASSFTINVIKSPITGATLELYDNPTNNRDFPTPGEIPLWSNIVPTFEPNEVKTLPAEVAGINVNTFIAQEFGYFIPPATALYGFRVEAASKGWLFLSTDDDPKTAVKVAETITNGGYSAGINLIAGKKYYIKANYRNQFSGSHFLKVSFQYKVTTTWTAWTGIKDDQLVPYNDKSAPTTPSNFKVLVKGITDVHVAWSPSTDDIKLTGYHVYVDGNLFNTSPTLDTNILITGLSASTAYSIVVRAVDFNKKMSDISNVINLTTYAPDAVKPTAPTNLKSLNETGVAVKLGWDAATDAQTEIRGYYVFLNGVKVNNTLSYFTNLNVTGLKPKTSYKFKVIAEDVAGNQSDSSALFQITTPAFDPLNNSDGVHKGQVSIILEPVCRQIGLGLQTGNASATDQILKDFNPGAIRWGGIDANLDKLSDNSSGGYTYASHLDAANKLDAYACYALGVDSTTDFYKDINTVSHMVEYLAGPTTSTWGAKRNSQGFPNLMTNCKGIVFEFGNEVWGSASHHAQFANGSAYGHWARQRSVLMKNSPYYDKAKMFTSYSGRHVNEYLYMWNDLVLPQDTGQVDWLSVSGYMGGNLTYDPLIETDQSETMYYRNANKSAAQAYTGMIELKKFMIRTNKRILPMYMYEGNMTTESYRGRIGQAIIFTDYYLTMNELGVAVPIVFVYSSSGQWQILEGSKKLPLFHTSALFNKYCKNTTTLKTEFSTNDKLIDGNLNPIQNYAPVGCHAYTENGKYRLVLFNRDFDNDFIVRVNLPEGFTLTGTDSIHTIVSATDYSSKDIVYTKAALTGFADSMLVTVPKYGMVLITFNGPVQNYGSKPIYNVDYTKVSSLTIESVTGEYSIATHKGFLDFKATIEPADAMYKDLNWEVLDNDEAAMFYPATMKIYGSGYAKGNGSVTLKASTKDGSNLTDQKMISISGQNLDEYKDDEGVIVYPNPVQDYVSIIVPKDNAMLTLYSTMGAVVIQKEMQSTTETLQLSNLPSGIYFIKIEMEGIVSTRKIVKQ